VARPLRLVGYVLTRNEAANIRRSLTSVLQVTSQIVVVDSESTDETRSIATDLGADVVVHPFEGFSVQRNWALDYVKDKYRPDYILSLDADEWLSEDLAEAIRKRTADGTLSEHDVYLFHRLVRFDGRILRWGGFANIWLPRMFRTNSGRYENRRVNEHLAIRPTATIGRLPGTLVNDDVESWEDYIAKHNRYSTLEAGSRIELRRGTAEMTTFVDALRRPYLRRRWLREHVWQRLSARPALRFVQMYLVAGGILDGRAGFRRALFEAWQEMCIDLKVEAQEHPGPP
jgi:glycosyltransferase involved in cell wall biosynthesis